MEYILPDMQWQLVIEYMTAELVGSTCALSLVQLQYAGMFIVGMYTQYVELNYLANW